MELTQTVLIVSRDLFSIWLHAEVIVILWGLSLSPSVSMLLCCVGMNGESKEMTNVLYWILFTDTFSCVCHQASGLKQFCFWFIFGKQLAPVLVGQQLFWGFFLWFSSVLAGKCWNCTRNLAATVHSTHFPVHCTQFFISPMKCTVLIIYEC